MHVLPFFSKYFFVLVNIHSYYLGAINRKGSVLVS